MEVAAIRFTEATALSFVEAAAIRCAMVHLPGGGGHVNIMDIDSEKRQNFLQAQGAGQPVFFPNGLCGKETHGVSIPPRQIGVVKFQKSAARPGGGGGPKWRVPPPGAKGAEFFIFPLAL